MSQLGQSDQSRLFDSKMLPQPLPINNHRYIDKNIHETIDRIQSYEIHQKKLIRIKEELEKNRLKKINGDTSYEHLKSQMNHNKLRSYEFTETEKINEIKRSNQILLEKLLDISKGKRCDVKQENIQIAIPQSKSLNYQVKKREAERIDQENQKIMERIVNQNPSLSSKKMHHDYIEQLRYKKMKEQNKMGMSVEKIIEKKRKMVLEARSTILPLLNTKLNSPGATEPMGRNNFNIGGSIDVHSQRVIQNSSEIISHTLPIHNEYQSQQHNTSQSAQNSNNRYANKTQLTKLSHTVSPKSQRQRRVIARSELSDYKEKNSQIGQTTSLNNNYHKPNKIMLESITQSSTNPNTKQNKPPVAPSLHNKSFANSSKLHQNNQINQSQIPPIRTNKNIAKANQKLPPGSYFSHTTNSSSSKNKQTNSSTIDTQQNQNQATLDTNLANLPNSPIHEQEITPKVSINHNMNHQNTLSKQQKQQIQDAEDIQDQIIDDEIIDEDDYVEDFLEGADNSKNLSKQQTERKTIPQTNLIIAEQKQIQGKQFEKTQIKKQETIKTNNNQSYMDDSKTYLERNSILSGINDTSNVKNGGTGGLNDVEDQQYEEEDFEEEIID